MGQVAPARTLHLLRWRAGHGCPAGCFSPFEGCVAQRGLLVSLHCIVLSGKTHVPMTPQRPSRAHGPRHEPFGGFLRSVWSCRSERKRAIASVPSLRLLQRKGLGITVQDSSSKAAFQLCEGDPSMMLLGELGDRAAVTAPATAGCCRAAPRGFQGSLDALSFEKKAGSVSAIAV